MHTLYTIGYEGAELSDLIGTLVEAGVQHVLDVREVPQSRRRGFSKKALGEALSGQKIGYSHDRQLGDPKHGREAARRGDMVQFKMIFEAHLDLPASQEALRGAAEIIEEKRTVLLCYERDPRQCHRTLVAQRLLGLRSLKIENLGVRDYGKQRVSVVAAEADRHA